MTNGWQEVPLGKLLTRIKNEVLIQDFERYQRLTIHGNNKGISIRDEFEGHQIGTKKQFVVHKGQFLLSKIDAMNGAFGIVPEHVEKGIITSNFWAYDVDEENLLPKYFNYLTHTRTFQQFCIQSSSGTTHRKYLQEDLFLGKEIPLPGLDEQHRIVKNIEALSARIVKAQSLRDEALHEADILIYSAMRQIFDPQKIKSKVHLEKTCIAIIDNLHSNPDYSGDCTVPCIRSSDVGWGELFLHTARKTSEKEYQRRTVRGEPSENDIVLVREGGGTGKAALIGKNQRFSLGQRVMMLRPNPEIVLPKFLLYQLMSPHIFEEQILPRAKGSASPHLNIGSLRNFDFLLPPLDEQRRIVAYLDSVQAQLASLQELQSQTQEELDALLPSVLDRAFKGEL
jgi:type I restriction enzyme S subunit